MAGNETLRAHCGACAGLMILHVKRDAETGIEYAYWYGCLECGTMTTQRATAAESAEDVVWVVARQRRLKQAA